MTCMMNQTIMTTERWRVTCDIVRGVLEYYLEDAETGERRGTYDCEAWAQRDADELNRQEWAKQVIRRDPPGSIPERIEAIHIAQSVLGRLVTTEELYKWAGGSK